MRRAPLNYLITIVLGAMLWAVAAIVVGNYLGNIVVLQVRTTDDFLAAYRTMLMIAAAPGVAAALYWYYYGSRDTTAGRLAEARRKWTVAFVTEVVVAALLLVWLVYLLREEALTAGNYGVIFGMISLLTFVFFWFCTFLMSPRAVEYIPWGKR